MEVQESRPCGKMNQGFHPDGILDGNVYRATDKHAAYAKDNPVMSVNFAATRFHALGVPPTTRFGPQGVTMQASSDQSMLPLFG